jgi:hypothetical protein
MLAIRLTFSLLLLLGLGVLLALLIGKVRHGTTHFVRRRLKCLYQQQGGLVSFFAALVLWFASKPLLKELDPTTAPFDLGWMQTILMSTMRVLVFHGLTKYFLKLYWPAVDRYLGQHFVYDFFRLTTWQKVLISSLLFLGFFYGFAQLTH